VNCDKKEIKMKKKINHKGVTLLEMMIIAVVIGVASMLALPQFGKTSDRLKLKNTGKEIMSSLRLARSSAISQRCQFGVYFDLNSRRYIIFEDVANPSSFTYDVGLDSVIVSKALPGNVNFGSNSFPNFVAIFKPTGSAASSGSVQVTSSGKYTGSMTVDVLGSTGRVKLIFNDT
jgi:Tfp pilus assembly protein FimT